ncbi:hypothetical protein DFH29DRAFT_973389 [Suillus ampliporus]|nr:hypothetical protein DFH29DRAFT_973389 [Suillus ampliporus]
MGSNYSAAYPFRMQNTVGHTSPASSQYVVTVSDTHSAVPATSNPHSVPWSSDNILNRTVSHGFSRSSPTLDGLEGVSFCPSDSLSMGSDYLSSYASQTYALHCYSLFIMILVYRQNPWQDFVTPQPLPSQIQSLTSQPLASSIPVQNNTSPPLFTCHWLHNNEVCGYEGTVKDLAGHCKCRHLAKRPGTLIKCIWEGCDYHRQGNPSINVMLRHSVWRHISDVHLGIRRSTKS